MNTNTFKYDPTIHSRPATMLLGLTSSCNLQCTYCFVHQNPNTMSLDTAKAAIEWYLSNEPQVPTVNFFGGEPLLCFESLIKPLVEQYPNIHFGITTNGVLLTEPIVDFLYAHNIPPLLSFDGIDQNKQRPSTTFNSYDAVIKNIPYLLLRFPNTIMRATMTKYSIITTYGTYRLAAKLGFRHITFCPNEFEDWSPDYLYDSLLIEFQSIALDLYKDPTLPSCDPISSSIQRLKTNLMIPEHPEIMRCGLGTTSCAITPNGEIIPCQEKTSSPTVIIGHVDTGIDTAAHETFLTDYFNKKPTCSQNCSAAERVFCLSETCPSRLEDLSFKLSSSHCVFVRAAYQAALPLVSSRKPQFNK